MRSKILAAVALFSLALPGAAFADHRDWAESRSDALDRPARLGFLVVSNPNKAGLEILLDGREVGFVEAHDTARLGPFPEGSTRVETRFVCDKRALKHTITSERIDIDRRHTARIRVPYSDLAVVEVTNRWIEPMRIRVDGKRVGRVPAGQMFAVLAPRSARLALIEPHGAEALVTSVRGSGLETGELSLVVPETAEITVSNPSAASLELLDRGGRVIATLRPWSTRSVRLASGRVKLQASYRGRVVAKTRMIASPFCDAAWDIELPATASVSVRNDNAVMFTVYADGRYLGRVGSGQTARFDGIEPGLVQLRVEANRSGRVYQESVRLSVDPLDGAFAAPRLAVSDGRRGYESSSSCSKSSSVSRSRSRSRSRIVYRTSWGW